MSGCKSCGFHIVDARSDGLCTDCYFEQLEDDDFREEQEERDHT